MQHAAVGSCAVKLGEDDRGEKYLVAYVVGSDEQVPQEEQVQTNKEEKAQAGKEALKLDQDQLREWLGDRLPVYMLPQYWVGLDRLPMTANGKVDKSALPAVDTAAVSRNTYVAPETELEQALSGLWSDLLGVAEVGLQDDFFALIQ